MSRYVDPNPHEFSANLIFAEEGSDGLAPYYALNRIVKENDGAKETTFKHNGEKFHANLFYSTSGLTSLKHPSSDLNSIYEYHIKIRSLDQESHDRAELRGGTFNISPRTPRLQSENGLVQTPFIDTEKTGINVSVKGSNIEFRDYPTLLGKALAALGVNPRYVKDPSEWSNIQDMSLEIRVNRARSGSIYAVKGPIPAISEVLVGDHSFRPVRPRAERSNPAPPAHFPLMCVTNVTPNKRQVSLASVERLNHPPPRVNELALPLDWGFLDSGVKRHQGNPNENNLNSTKPPYDVLNYWIFKVPIR